MSTRDMTDHEFAEACQRNQLQLVACWLFDRKRGGGGYGLIYRGRKVDKRASLAHALRCREDAEAQAEQARRKRDEAFAALIGVEPDTGACIYEHLGFLAFVRDLEDEIGPELVRPALADLPSWRPRVIVKGDPINKEMGWEDGR